LLYTQYVSYFFTSAHVPDERHDPGGPLTEAANAALLIVGGPFPISTHGTFVI